MLLRATFCESNDTDEEIFGAYKALIFPQKHTDYAITI